MILPEHLICMADQLPLASVFSLSCYYDCFRMGSSLKIGNHRLFINNKLISYKNSKISHYEGSKIALFLI